MSVFLFIFGGGGNDVSKKHRKVAYEVKETAEESENEVGCPYCYYGHPRLLRCPNMFQQLVIKWGEGAGMIGCPMV